MPVTVDHDVRRREVAEAVWRVLADTGFAGLSLRAVAKEMGATTGLLTHYFRSKRELVQHALEVVHERTVPRMQEAETPDHGVDGLRVRLRAVLVDDDEATVLSKVWVGFWDLALADAELAPGGGGALRTLARSGSGRWSTRRSRPESSLPGATARRSSTC